MATDVDETDQVSSAVSTTRPRLDRVCGVAAGDPPLDRDAAAARLATHDLGPRSVCVHGFPELPVGQASATLAVAVTEPADGRLHVHGGLPCEVSPERLVVVVTSVRCQMSMTRTARIPTLS